MKVHLYSKPDPNNANFYAISEYYPFGAAVAVTGHPFGGAMKEVVINPSREAYDAILARKSKDGYFHLITLDIPECNALAAVTCARDVFFQSVEVAIKNAVDEECYLPIIEQIAASHQFVYEGVVRAREWLTNNPRQAMPLFPVPVIPLAGGHGCYF